MITTLILFNTGEKIKRTHTLNRKPFFEKVMRISLYLTRIMKKKKRKEKTRKRDEQFVKIIKLTFFAHMYENIFVAFLFCRARIGKKNKTDKKKHTQNIQNQIKGILRSQGAGQFLNVLWSHCDTCARAHTQREMFQIEMLLCLKKK